MNSNQELLSLIIRCIDFAAKKHQNQRRKDVAQTPYINHPIDVANTLIQEGKVFDIVVILAAILHDCVEDTDTTFAEIEQQFGLEICQVVQEVTDDKKLPPVQRKEMLVQRVPQLSHNAKTLKLADLLCNLRDLERSTPIGWTSRKVLQYVQWAKAVRDGCDNTNSSLENILDDFFAYYLD